MRILDQLRCKVAMACVVALALCSATTISPGAPPQERLPGSDLGLNAAIADSDLIETAEYQSFGMAMSSAAMYCSGVRIRPASIHKGTAQPDNGTGLWMVISSGETEPVAGQEYIFFLQGRSIIKMLPQSEENLKTIAAMSKRVESLKGHDGGLLGSGIGLDEAVKRADTVKTVAFDSFSPESTSGATKTISKVVVRPFGPFFKGMWADWKSQEPQTYRLSASAQEAIPEVGEQYIVFIKDRTIFKAVLRTSANYHAVDKLATNHASD